MRYFIRKIESNRCVVLSVFILILFIRTIVRQNNDILQQVDLWDKHLKAIIWKRLTMSKKIKKHCLKWKSFLFLYENTYSKFPFLHRHIQSLREFKLCDHRKVTILSCDFFLSTCYLLSCYVQEESCWTFSRNKIIPGQGQLLTLTSTYYVMPVLVFIERKMSHWWRAMA